MVTSSNNAPDGAPNEAFVKFDRVQKSYDGETLVVKDLNLELPKGEFLTMLGPSGSGKTTCLMMLAGFETATHGDILLDGVSINNIPPHKRGIGMVFQNYALFPHMTVGENLSFPLEVRGMDKSVREEKVKRALDMVQMGSFINRRPAQLSGGQQQRLGICRALMLQPDVLLLDEPFSAVDPITRLGLYESFEQVKTTDPATVVLVTHDLREAKRLADFMVILDQGEIVQAGAPADVLANPATPYAERLIESQLS